MDERTLFYRTLSHKPHDQVMFYCVFTEACRENIIRELALPEDTDLYAYFPMHAQRDVHPLEALNGDPHFQYDFWQHYRDMEIKPGSWLDGMGILHEPGSMYHFTHYVSPLRHAETLREVERFPYARILPGSVEKMRREVEALHARGLVAQCWVGNLFEAAWQMRGMDRFLTDMLEAPEICECLLEKAAQRNTELARAAALAGVDMIRTGDDVGDQQGMMMSPALWRRMIKPLHARVFNAAREVRPDIAVWYHSDGNITSIVSELIDIGITVLNPLQPECMDVGDMKRRYGDALVFDGLIGTQSVMPFGTPQQVRDTVYRMLDLAGGDGALILSPTHVLEPEVPVQNIVAFVEACSK